MTNSRNVFADLIPQGQQQPAPEEEMGRFMSAVTGFNTGVERFAQGTLQGLNDLTRYATGNRVGNDYKKGLERAAQQREADYAAAERSHPNYAAGGAIAGGVAGTAPLMAIPGLGQTAMARAVSSGALQGGLTGAGQYVNEGESRLNNALMGAGVGGAAGGVLQGIGKLVGKGYNTIKGNYANPAEEAVVNLGKQYDVPVFASDASSNRLMRNVGRTLEEVPLIGLQGERQAQMMAAKNAAEGVVDQFKGSMDDMAFGGRTGLRNIEKAIDEGGIRAAGAKQIIEQVKDAGDDWNKIMQTSGNVQLFRSKLLADAKYNKVSQIADKFGDVPRANTLRAIDGAIKDVSEGILPDNSLLNKLNTMKQNLAGREFTYSQLRNARSEVSDLISDSFTGANAAVGKKGVGSLQGIKNALAQDLDSFANTHGPELKTVWRNADNFYGNYVAPAKTRALATALKTAKPDEIYSQFIKVGAREGGKGSGNAKIFYDALDNKGRAAVRYGMVSEAFEKAYKPELDQFSPAQFAGNIERYSAAKGVFFNPTQKAEINGFANLMRHVERSFQAVNKPETGVRNIPYFVGGAGALGAYTNPVATAGMAGMTYGIKKLFTTDAGKKFLLSASTLKPGSPGMAGAAEILKRIIQQGAVVNNFDEPNQSQQVNANPAPSQNMSGPNPFADLIPAR